MLKVQYKRPYINYIPYGLLNNSAFFFVLGFKFSLNAEN